VHSHLLAFPFHPIFSHPIPVLTGTLLLSLNQSLNLLFLSTLYSPCSSSLYSAIPQLGISAAETSISVADPIPGKIRHCETHSCACSCHDHNHSHLLRTPCLFCSTTASSFDHSLSGLPCNLDDQSHQRLCILVHRHFALLSIVAFNYYHYCNQIFGHPSEIVVEHLTNCSLSDCK
jgi:hypothetical protein